jgi:hypothetical protein
MPGDQLSQIAQRHAASSKALEPDPEHRELAAASTTAARPVPVASCRPDRQQAGRPGGTDQAAERTLNGLVRG